MCPKLESSSVILQKSLNQIQFLDFSCAAVVVGDDLMTGSCLVSRVKYASSKQQQNKY